MCNNALPANVLQPLLFNQPSQSVKRPTSLESAYTLLILALEEQLDAESGRASGFLWADGLPFASVHLCGACKPIYGFASSDRGTADVRLDTSMSYLYRLPRKGRTRLMISHGWRVNNDIA